MTWHITTSVTRHHGYWEARVLIEEETEAGYVGRWPTVTVRRKTRRQAVEVAVSRAIAEAEASP